MCGIWVWPSQGKSPTATSQCGLASQGGAHHDSYLVRDAVGILYPVFHLDVLDKTNTTEVRGILQFDMAVYHMGLQSPLVPEIAALLTMIHQPSVWGRLWVSCKGDPERKKGMIINKTQLDPIWGADCLVCLRPSSPRLDVPPLGKAWKKIMVYGVTFTLVTDDHHSRWPFEPQG